MKRIVLIFSLFFAPGVFAQEALKPSTFHRLLVFNSQSELMVVKVKNSDRWVTPGWYQDGKLSIRQGLDALAGTYGVTIEKPVLRGVFTLQDSQGELSTRLIYNTTITGGTLKSPEIIDEIRWLSVPQAIDIITFPHITAQLAQITQHPDTIWGGFQRMQLDGEKQAVKIMEPFYPLATSALTTSP